MTLFRKVFQNQARPIDKPEASETDPMMPAFDAVGQGADPFVLDQEAHKVVDHGSGAKHSVGEDDPTAEQQEAITETTVAVEKADPEHPEVAELLETLNPPDELDAQETSGPRSPISNGPQTDAEIADFMNRALSDDAPADSDTSELSTDAEHADELEFALPTGSFSEPQEDHAETDAAPDGVLDDLDDAVSDRADQHLPTEDDDDDMPVSAEAAQDFEEPAEASDIAGHHDGSEPQAEDADHEDVSDFARQQMAGLAQTEISAQPSDERDTAAPAETSHAPYEAPSVTDDTTATPALDLSAGVAPSPGAGRAGRRAGRVKTRLLGFNREDEGIDPMGQVAESTATPQREKFPVGWLVVVEGPGVGHAFSIFTGASMIGRGEDQVIRLDFGDNSISRHNHAAIAYDEEANKFYVGHGGKSNIIRRNARPVLSTEELHHADLLRIGETTLRFVALCGSDFQWHRTGGGDASGV